MNRNIAIVVCIAALASLAGCATSQKPVAAPATEAPRTYDAAEYTAPEEKEIFVSEPQETQARKDTHENGLQPSLVTQRKAKQLYPLGH